MISFWISVVPPKINWMRMSTPELTIVPESSGLLLPPVKAEPHLVSTSRGVRSCAIIEDEERRLAEIHDRYGKGTW
jgi:hypothetical protein